MTIAIADSSVLIFYARIDRLDILRNLFSEVLIPSAVLSEVSSDGAIRPGASSVLSTDWIQLRTVTAASPLLQVAGLGPGEIEAIHLALELGGTPVLLLDDQKARRTATELQLSSVGSVGILLRAKATRYVANIRPLLADLIAAGLFVSDALVNEVLRLAGES